MTPTNHLLHNRHVQQTPEKKSMKSLSIDQETQVVRGELPSSDSSGGATPEEGPISEGTTVSMDDTDDDDYEIDDDQQENFEEMLSRLTGAGVKFA